MALSLDAGLVAETAGRLRSRIGERFPGSGIERVAEEVARVAGAAIGRQQRIGAPNRPLRALACLFGAALLLLPVATALTIHLDPTVQRWTEVVAAADSFFQTLVFLGAAIFFVVSLETRLKRNTVVRWLHELRSLAHVIDMHQLRKDPDRFLAFGPAPESSPPSEMTPFEMNRYFDYCSELLSILSKVAAVFGQEMRDPAALEAVDGIESLVSGLIHKIWQKLQILDRIVASQGGLQSGR